ncbi:MAG: galactose-1-phosphate uridylyltransferase, partial [Lachnospiraceae bacterium]|nr:galactose-1-phosphate uridylyltransferase [Lachnospiraceae bacterium]
AWLRGLRASYGAASGTIDNTHAERILRDEVGKVFAQVLEDAGVYKRTSEGQAAFDRFVRSVL